MFLEDGRIEIDNNLVENAIRPTAGAKKNWPFFGDAEASERGAILYTIIVACRVPQETRGTYLGDVLTYFPL